LFCRVCGVHIHHTNILFHEDCPGIFDFFSQAKVPEKYGSKKSKVKKPKVKRSVTQPAKSIIERTICSHPMLKRVQKEVRELKKKSVKKYKK
jgi:hypothetical protein